MGFFKSFFKKRPSPILGQSIKESGNVFMMLFGAVGMVGVIGASTMTVMKGPVKTMSQVTQRTVAENNMIAAGKLALIAGKDNDCDSDDVAEPVEFVTAVGGITGGGTIPASIGVAKQDPWGNEYGYCVWDHGDGDAATPNAGDGDDDDGTCGVDTNYLAGTDSGTEYVLAIVSSGPDRMFNTSCVDFVAPGTATIVKTPGSDDIILGYTMAEASSIAGGLWTDDAGTATIAKNLSVKDASDVEQFSFDTAAKTLTLGDGTTGTGQFPSVRTDFLSAYNNAAIGVTSNISSDSLISTSDNVDVGGDAFLGNAITDIVTIAGGTTIGNGLGVTGATALQATTVSSLNAGSGAITTTGTLNAGTSTLGATGVSSLNAGSGAITTTGTLGAGTSTLGATTVGSLDAGSGAIQTTGTLDAGTSTLGATTVGSLDAGSGAIQTTGTLNAGTTTLGATTLSGELAMGSNKITGLGAPTAAADATTKAYVDAQVAAGTGYTETDPQVGDVSTAGKWCQTDGTSVECTFDLPGETDPQVGTLTNGRWCTTDGTSINCTENTPSGLPSGCTSGQVAEYNGSTWVCASGGGDTLSGLSCTNGEVAKFNGTAWVCAKDGVGGGGIVVETENYNLTFTQLNPGSVIGATEQTLTASDGVFGDKFAYGMDVDGDYAVVSAYEHNSNAGAVYVYNKNGGGTWVEQQKIEVSAGTFFSNSVAISGDTIVIGAHLENNGASSGSAYIFKRSGATWSQEAKLVPGDGGSDWFGRFVDIDGDTVIVSAPRDDDLGSDSGAIYVFTRSGTTWTQQQKVVASENTSGMAFGSQAFAVGEPIAVSGDTMVVGAPNATTGRGYVYIFTRSGTTWTQTQRERGSGIGADMHFANAVDIDGDTFVTGAPDDGAGLGYIHVYTKSGATWSEQQRFRGSDSTTGDVIGSDVAIDGDTITVGAAYDDDNGNASGMAFVFTRSGSTWTEITKLIDSTNGGGDQYGRMVAMGNGSLLIGNTREEAFVYNTGTSTLNGQITDAGTNGSLATYIPKGTVFEVQGTASNDGIYTTNSVVDADTINVTDVVTNETNVPAVILKTTIPNPLEALDCTDGQVTVYNGVLGVWECGDAASSDTLSALSCSANEVAQYDGSDWVCASIADSDTLSALSCSANEIAQWDGSDWVCATVASSDTLDGLACSSGQVAKWNGSAWACAADNNDGSDLPGGGTTIEDRNYNLTFIEADPITAIQGSETKLIGNAADDRFGQFIARDGNTLVSSHYRDIKVYINDTGSWVLQDTISLTGIIDSIDISGDKIIVGSPSKAEIYARSGSTWSLEQNLVGDTGGGGYGDDVAIDGNYAMVTNRYAAGNNGKVFVYFWNGSSWALQQELTKSGSDFFGASADLNDDMLVVSQSWNSGQGRIYTYKRSGTTWVEQNNITGSNVSANAGLCVAVDSFTMAFCEITGGTNRQVQIYTYNGSIWQHQQTIGPNNFMYIAGANLKIKGNRMVFGYTEQAFVYDRVVSTWSETLNITGSDTVSGDTYGSAVAFENDEIHIGAHQDDDNGDRSGSVYNYDLAATGAKARITDVGASGNFANFLPIGTAFEISGTGSNDGAYATHSIVDLNTIQVSQSVTNESSVSATVSKTTTTVTEPGTIYSLNCTDGQVAVYNDTTDEWECGAGGGSDTLAGLSCADGEIAKWNNGGSVWECSPDTGSDNLGDHTATQALDMATFEVDNVGGVNFESITGAAPLSGVGGIQSGTDIIAVSGNACTNVGELARSATDQLLVCEDTTTITDDSCSGFTVGALSISSDGQLHVCMN